MNRNRHDGARLSQPMPPNLHIGFTLSPFPYNPLNFLT